METNPVVLITGASGGIGQACALAFAKAGYNVIIHYSSSKEKAEAVSAQCVAVGVKTYLYGADVKDSASVAGMFEWIGKEIGRLDVLVNNSGITKDKLLLRMEESDFEDVIDVNLKGAFLCSKHAVKLMFKKKRGVILNMASVVGISGNVGQSNYAASKGGLIAMTRSLAKEVASWGIRVNAIAPGFIETAMTEVLSDEIKAKLLANIPLKRLGQVEDVANAAVFLASDKASYITGQTIAIDGGMTY